MTTRQLRAALKRLGITQVEAARRLRVNPSTLRRWLAGSRRIPGPVAVVMDLWLRVPESVVVERNGLLPLERELRGLKRRRRLK